MKLEPKHHYLIELLASISDTRTKEEKSVEAGFAPKYVYQFEKKEGVADAIYKRMRENIAKALPTIYNALYMQAKGGDTAAIRTFMQCAGEIQAGTNVTTNVVQTNNGKDFQEHFKEAQEYREGLIRRARATSLEDLD